MTKYKVLSLFSGCGGLDLGFKEAGFEIVWANDIDKEAVETYKANVGQEIVLGDIKNIDPSTIQKNVDVIIGGFPCLGFTIAKGSKRTIDDKNNSLYKEYLRFVKEKKPKIFLIENVVGIKSGKEFEQFFENMLKEFSALGYNVSYKILYAQHYGVPQNRKRIIIVGARIDIDEHFVFPLHVLNTPITLKQAIFDLPIEESNIIHNHKALKHKVKVNAYVGNRQLDWNKPSPTITGRGSRTGGAVIHPHPSLARRLTARECARIQSFPDDFIFYGSLGACFAQIGNAVPPLLSYYLAISVLSFLDGSLINPVTPKFNLPYIKEIENNTKLGDLVLC